MTLKKFIIFLVCFIVITFGVLALLMADIDWSWLTGAKKVGEITFEYYDGQGADGIGSLVNTQTVGLYETKNGEPQTKKKKSKFLTGNVVTPEPGRNFAGWEMDGFDGLRTGGSYVQEGLTKDYDGTRLIASYGFNEYALTFQSCLSGVANPPQVKNIKYSLGDISFIYEGQYDLETQRAGFLGWFTERDGGYRIPENSFFEFTTNKTLYGHWDTSIKRFDITFNMNAPGSGLSNPAKIAVNKNSDMNQLLPTQPTDFNWPNHLFMGWYTGGERYETVGDVYADATNTTTSIQLTATWKQLFDLKFAISSSDSGAYISGSAVTGQPTSYTYPVRDVADFAKSFVELGIAATKDNAVFDGWYWPSTSGTRFENVQAIAEKLGSSATEITLTAKFVNTGNPPPTGKYYLTVRNGSNSAQNTGWDATVGSVQVISATALFSNPGKTFDHWEVDGIGYPAGQTTVSFTMPAKAIIATAHYKDAAVTYRLTVNSSTDDGKTPFSPYVSGDYSSGKNVVFYVSDFDIFKSQGYTFDYWTVNSGSTRYTGNHTVTMNGNITVTAHYKRTDSNKYRLTVRNAVNSGQNTYWDAEIGAVQIIAASALFSNPGWTFDHWEVDGISYPKGQATISFAMPARAITAIAYYR